MQQQQFRLRKHENEKALLLIYQAVSSVVNMHALFLSLILFLTWVHGSISGDSKVSVAIVCLMKDNADILPFWLEYHSKLVGIENIVILDNFSRESSHTPSILRKWQKKGLKVEWKQGPYLLKGQLTLAAFQKHFPTVDIGIPLDIDEIVSGYKNGTPVPTKMAFQEGLEDFWKRSIGCGAMTHYYITCCNVVTDTVESIDHVIENIYAFADGKKMFRIGEVKEIDHGNHHVLLKNGECTQNVTSLGLLHYHHRNPRLTFQHALLDLKGFGYIDDLVTAENAHKFLPFFEYILRTSLDGAHKAEEVVRFIKEGYTSLMYGCDDRPDLYKIGNASTILGNM